MAGIARTLEYLPQSDPDYKRYETQLQRMAAAVAALQDPKDGLWHSDLLDPGAFLLAGAQIVDLSSAKHARSRQGWK